MSNFYQTLECDRCLFFSVNPYLRCAVHPEGVKKGCCLDFCVDPQSQQELEEFQSLEWVINIPIEREEAFGYYYGELICQPQQWLTTSEKIALLDSHPFFTRHCPQCNYQFDDEQIVHWDCPSCGWIDDSL